jgi:hypothetical protein
MKKPVREDEEPYISSNLFQPAQKVMPLQNLVKKDPVKKAAKAKAKCEPGKIKPA